MNLEAAIVLAAQAHAGQTDQQNAPYIRHCLRVMERLAPDVNAMVVGVLHDLLEDTEATLTPDDLSYDQWHALQLLTKRDGESYEDYIVRLCGPIQPPGRLARRVKLADLADNLARNHRLRDPKRSLLRARYEAAQRVIAKRDGIEIKAAA